MDTFGINNEETTQEDKTSLSGNRGEWSEIYIFLTLVESGRIYAADNKMRKIPDTYLDIVKIIREEIENRVYEYHPGPDLRIFLNGQDTGEIVLNRDLHKNSRIVWYMINDVKGNRLQSEEVTKFLDKIHIHKLKAPATKTSNFFGGTPDIVMEVSDYKTGIVSTVGFSCKSKKATLFNASGDNTNFVFRVTGPVSDEIMCNFNNIFKVINKKTSDGTTNAKNTIATGARMEYLREIGCELEFVGTAKDTARKNLIMSGGMEMPTIVAEMLRYYFFEKSGTALHNKMSVILKHLAKVDPVGYGFENLEEVYRAKLGKLLYDMFTGMRLGTPWNGRCDVNGGYVLVTSSGEVLAYHTCIADEFKDFLIENLGLEGCDNGRHHSMQMYKRDGEYFLKFNLQVRFSR